MRYFISLLAFSLLAGGASAQKIGGPTGPDGKTQVQCDLPVAQRTKNVGGTDGAGLCVFSSIGHAARFQNEKRLVDFQENMKHERGGGWPEKVDQMIAKYGKGTDYLQYEGTDLEVLKTALRTGRMPCVTYDGRCPHYGARTRIAHMVNIVYGDDQWFCVLDNNFVGDDELVWLTPAEFKARWTGGKQGWAVFLCAPPPPPIPMLPRKAEVEAFELVAFTEGCKCGKDCQAGCDCGCQAACKCGDNCPLGCDCGCNLTPLGKVIGAAIRQSSCPSCSGGSCGPSFLSPFPTLTVSPVPPAAQPPAVTEAPIWWYQEGHPLNVRVLYRGSELLGKMDLDTGEYARWLSASKSFTVIAAGPPIAPPDRNVFARLKPEVIPVIPIEMQEPPSENFGMNWKPNGSERHSINGIEVNRKAFMEALSAKGSLPDDAKLIRMTAILPSGELSKLETALAGPLADWKTKLVYQGYEPGHWHVSKDLGFPDRGILIEGPTGADGKGQAIHYQHDFIDAPDLLVALRRAADPNFDVNKVPDLRKAAPKVDPKTPASGDSTWVWFVIVLGGALVLVLVNTNKVKTA